MFSKKHCTGSSLYMHTFVKYGSDCRLDFLIITHSCKWEAIYTFDVAETPRELSSEFICESHSQEFLMPWLFKYSSTRKVFYTDGEFRTQCPWLQSSRDMPWSITARGSRRARAGKAWAFSLSFWKPLSSGDLQLRFC